MLKVNFGTGSGNYESELSLDVLMEQVGSEVTYTQESVIIEDEEGNTVAKLPWYGCTSSDDDVVTASFGDFGFYGEWQVEF